MYLDHCSNVVNFCLWKAEPRQSLLCSDHCFCSLMTPICHQYCTVQGDRNAGVPHSWGIQAIPVSFQEKKIIEKWKGGKRSAFLLSSVPFCHCLGKQGRATAVSRWYVRVPELSYTQEMALSIGATFVEVQLAKWVLCSWSAPRNAPPESLSVGNLKTPVLLEGSCSDGGGGMLTVAKGRHEKQGASVWTKKQPAGRSVYTQPCSCPASSVPAPTAPSTVAVVWLSSSVPDHSRSVKIAWKWKNKYVFSSHRSGPFTHTGFVWYNCASTSLSGCPEVLQLPSWAHRPHSTPTVAQEPFLAYFCLSRAVLMLRRAGGDRRAALVHCPSATQYGARLPSMR